MCPLWCSPCLHRLGTHSRSPFMTIGPAAPTPRSLLNWPGVSGDGGDCCFCWVPGLLSLLLFFSSSLLLLLLLLATFLKTRQRNDHIIINSITAINEHNIGISVNSYDYVAVSTTVWVRQLFMLCTIAGEGRPDLATTVGESPSEQRRRLRSLNCHSPVERYR